MVSGSYVVSRIAFQARKSFEKQPKAPESFFDNGNEKCICMHGFNEKGWIYCVMHTFTMRQHAQVVFCCYLYSRSTSSHVLQAHKSKSYF